MPSLKATAMRDFFDLLTDYGLYNRASHNLSGQIYRFGTNRVEFYSVDEPQKVRGRKRTYLWMNEANEFTYEDYRQLNMRTEKQIFMDYNPSDEDHWIYDRILTRDDCTLVPSTYLDAIGFLPEDIVKEIEQLRLEDDNYWKIYGLGERGQKTNIIYRPYDLLLQYPDFQDVFYGLDFGFNHPTALIQIGSKDGTHYLTEKLYESGLTNALLIREMERLIPNKSEPIYADSEDANRIEEIHGAGFNVIPCEKGKDSVVAGIQFVKSLHLFSRPDNVSLHKERSGYKWKQDKNGKVLEEPLKFNDHLMDALRYAVWMHLKHLRVGRKVLNWG